MTIRPGKYDLFILQGATLSAQFIWTDEEDALINLTGYTARLKAREGIDSTNAFLDLTTENGGITLGGAAGTITLNMTAAATAALTTQIGFYDLELISGASFVTRLLQGRIIISREVTR